MQLTLFMGAWMLVSPLMNDRWLVQVMLQLFLLNSALVTLWANPSWRRVRRIVFGLWVVSICGAALALLAVPEGWHRVARGVEILSTMPLMALLAVGILRFVFRRGTFERQLVRHDRRLSAHRADVRAGLPALAGHESGKFQPAGRCRRTLTPFAAYRHAVFQPDYAGDGRLRRHPAAHGTGSNARRDRSHGRTVLCRGPRRRFSWACTRRSNASNAALETAAVLSLWRESGAAVAFRPIQRLVVLAASTVLWFRPALHRAARAARRPSPSGCDRPRPYW